MSDPDPYKTTWIRIPDKHSYLHQLPGENEVVVLGPAKGLSEEPGEDELGADGEADLLLDEALAQHSPAHHPVSKVNLGKLPQHTCSVADPKRFYRDPDPKFNNL